MGESLTERRRVRDEGLRVVNRCQRGANLAIVERSSEEAQAKFVPAAAVTRTARTLFGIIGLKEFVGGLISWCGIPRLNRGTAPNTVRLEGDRGERN